MVLARARGPWPRDLVNHPEKLFNSFVVPKLEAESDRRIASGSPCRKCIRHCLAVLIDLSTSLFISISLPFYVRKRRVVVAFAHDGKMSVNCCPPWGKPPLALETVGHRANVEINVEAQILVVCGTSGRLNNGWDRMLISSMTF